MTNLPSATSIAGGIRRLLIILLAVCPLCSPVHAWNNGLALTPPMGWNSWNAFGANVTEAQVKAMADSMAGSGMKAAGYQYIVVDEGWKGGRDSNGNLYANAAQFPDGMQALAAYVHNDGLKFGVYTDAGTGDCGTGTAGSYGYEQKDIDQFAAWGVDYVKIDWCNSGNEDPQTEYTVFSNAIANCGRPMVFSLCEWGINNPWTWAPAIGNIWRTTFDCWDQWSGSDQFGNGGIYTQLEKNVGLESFAGPGGWNDPDMLQTGNTTNVGGSTGSGITDDEGRTQVSMWSILAAPLITGTNLSTMSSFTLASLTNSEALAVDQDPAGYQGNKVHDYGNGVEVWARQLSGTNTYAVALLNGSSSATNITVNWSDVGLPAGSATVRDLWAHQNLGTFSNSFTGANIGTHQTMLLEIVAGGSSAPPTGSGSFLFGIDMDGPAVTIAGNSWESYSTAQANGFSVSGNVGTWSGTYSFSLSPAADSNTTTMLESVLYESSNTNGQGFTMNQTIADGSYQVYLWMIENNVSNSRNADVTVQGAQVATAIGSLALGAWQEYGPYSAAVTNGTLSVGILRHSMGNPVCAGLAIYSAAGASPVSYEAEASNNTLAGGAVVVADSICSGGKKVGDVGNGGTLQFNGISSTGGSHTVTIYYINGDGSNRTAQMSVNGGTPTTVTFPSLGTWTAEQIATLQVTVPLNSGNNTIEFSNSSAWAPDFDRITVQ